MANQDTPPPEADIEAMKRRSQELKDKIEEQRRKNDMPINSSLGNPETDAENADGRRDLPDEDDD